MVTDGVVVAVAEKGGGMDPKSPTEASFASISISLSSSTVGSGDGERDSPACRAFEERRRTGSGDGGTHSGMSCGRFRSAGQRVKNGRV